MKTKLTVEQVEEIRQLKGTASQRTIGRRFNVSGHAIGGIWAGKTWRHRVGFYDPVKRSWLGPPGICVDCGKQVRATRCGDCQREFRHAQAVERAKAHLCKQCGGPNEDWGQRVNCRSCRAEKRVYDARRHAGAKASHRILKLKVLNAYGGARCKCCGEEHTEFLTLDHVNGGGNEHRLALTGSRTGGRLYRRLKELGYPSDLPVQVRCLNCNWAKGHFDSCPHERERNAAAVLD